MKSDISYIFFGSSRFSAFVLEELKRAGYEPKLVVDSARALPSPEELKAYNADVFIVASFGKILPKEILDIPTYGSLNVHPSLLPELRGPSPIQNLILHEEAGAVGVSIILMDEQMDHGPVVAQEKVSIEPWPDHYPIVEEKLARAGGSLLASTLERWVAREIIAHPQDDARATFTKMIETNDAQLDLSDEPEKNLRKVLAFGHEPGAFIMFKSKNGQDIRVKILNAKISDGAFIPTRVIPAGKKEMDWESFLRGNA